MRVTSELLRREKTSNYSKTSTSGVSLSGERRPGGAGGPSCCASRLRDPSGLACSAVRLTHQLRWGGIVGKFGLFFYLTRDGFEERFSTRSGSGQGRGKLLFPESYCKIREHTNAAANVWRRRWQRQSLCNVVEAEEAEALRT